MCLTVPELPACFIPAVQLQGSLLSNCSSTDRGISLSNTGSSRDVASVVSGRTAARPLKKRLYVAVEKWIYGWRWDGDSVEIGGF